MMFKYGFNPQMYPGHKPGSNPTYISYIRTNISVNQSVNHFIQKVE